MKTKNQEAVLASVLIIISFVFLGALIVLSDSIVVSSCQAIKVMVEANHKAHDGFWTFDRAGWGIGIFSVLHILFSLLIAFCAVKLKYFAGVKNEEKQIADWKKALYVIGIILMSVLTLFVIGLMLIYAIMYISVLFI